VLLVEQAELDKQVKLEQLAELVDKELVELVVQVILVELVELDRQVKLEQQVVLVVLVEQALVVLVE